jgi:hypothetical protein
MLCDVLSVIPHAFGCYGACCRPSLPCLPCLALPCFDLACLALPYLASPCLTLPCLALSCLLAFCFLPCLALPCFALPCLTLPHLALPSLRLLSPLPLFLLSITSYPSNVVTLQISYHKCQLGNNVQQVRPLRDIHGQRTPWTSSPFFLSLLLIF